MNNPVLLPVLTAIFCVLSRALLQVIDRSIFSRDHHFYFCMLCNALMPMILALLLCPSYVYLHQIIFEPGVILSGLGAQVTAVAISVSLKRMSVKYVVLAAKAADLVLPIMTFMIMSRFDSSSYIYSSATTFLFFPIAKMVWNKKEQVFFKMSLLIVGSLLLQCFVNQYFKMHQYAETWTSFLCLFTAILIWRTIFLGLFSFRFNGSSKAGTVPIAPLLFRALLAFVSQASFFLSITYFQSDLVWPILNFTPLASCLAAHFLLGERVGKTEIGVFLAFILFSIIFFWRIV